LGPGGQVLGGPEDRGIQLRRASGGYAERRCRGRGGQPGARGPGPGAARQEAARGRQARPREGVRQEAQGLLLDNCRLEGPHGAGGGHVITKRKLRFFWNGGWSLEQIEERFGVQIYAGDTPKEINANIWKGKAIVFPFKSD